jgi:hypothetical protein
MTVSVLAVGLLGTATVAAARLDAHRATSSETATRATTAAAAPTAAPTAARAPLESAAGTAASAEPAPTPEATPVRTLRRLRGDELNPKLVRQASRIIREHHREPFGTEIAFQLDGRAYVGRIERHYHPEGGPLKPWGFHAGCSLFAVEGR